MSADKEANKRAQIHNPIDHTRSILEKHLKLFSISTGNLKIKTMEKYLPGEKWTECGQLQNNYMYKSKLVMVPNACASLFTTFVASN